MDKPVLIFDHDGTLHDSMHVFAPAVHSAENWLRERGCEVNTVSDSVIASCLGLNSSDMWDRFNYDISPELMQEMVVFVDNEVGRLLKTGIAKWYEGTDEMLDVLRSEGYHMVILSNCEKKLADFYWKHFKMEKWFDRFYDCESFGFAPKTEIIKVILKEYGNGIMIGDRYTDFDCARSAGIPFLACGYGFAAKGELDGADEVAESPREIPDKIEKIIKKNKM